MRTPIRSQTNRKFYGPVRLLLKNVVYRAPAPLMPTTPLQDNRNSGFQITASCAHRRVEDGRGGLGHAATLRFPSPLIKPDVRISRIRLSDWFQPAAHGGTPSSVCVAEAVGDGRRAQQHRSASVFAAG